MKIGKSKIVVAVTVFVTIVSITLAFTVFKNSSAAPAKGGRGKGGSVVSVKTQELKMETLHGYVSTNGEIESQNSVSVFPDVSGKIVSMKVMLGSKVSKGDVIGYVDPSAPGSYFRQSPIYAPISGSVISTPVKNGSTVSSNSVITMIGDINNLQVRASVPERFVAVLKNGLKADVKVEAYPDEAFKATVVRVSPVVDALSRTKEVVLNFDKKDSRVNAGMFARVMLFTEDYDGAVTMPVDSLVQNGDKYFAYVVNKDKTVSKREVSLGKNVDGIVQITSGVREGERVVVQGQTTLADGSKIQDIGESKDTKGERTKGERK